MTLEGKMVEILTDDCYSGENLAEMAFTHAPIGLVVIEMRLIRDCEIAFAEMFGYRCDALRNQTFSMLYPSAEAFVNIRHHGVKQLRETNTYWDELIMARKDAALFWCRCAAIP